nr:phosphomannomutase [Desulforamulus aquiferis]
MGVGYDVRLTSIPLTSALVRGLRDSGCNVVDIGQCGTEQIYFATFHLGLDGGIMVTASHNPMDYNGMKLVTAGAKPISGDSGLRELEKLVIEGFQVTYKGSMGTYTKRDIMLEYAEHILSYINIDNLKPLKVVVNAGNGCAGPVIDAIEDRLPFQLIKIQHLPDGNFPKGIPNPLILENREATASVVRQTGADLGIAWDGDFDRCFFFDEKGQFIEGYYIVGLLAKSILAKNPGGKIIHDPRLTWNTKEIVEKAGGFPIESKTGHAFIKERMRAENAVYGGEMSAHHYFREFAYCDSGMIPWLLVLEQMCQKGKSLSKLVEDRMKAYPASGEINRKVNDANYVIKSIKGNYISETVNINYIDGLSMEFKDWRFNLRSSNTEPVIRLNVEAMGNKDLMEEKTKELLNFIDSLG